MSLIIINKKTLKNIALIVLDNKKTNITETTDGDFTIIKSGNFVVGLNIKNYNNYFQAQEGVHTLDKNQVEAIFKMGYEIKNYQSKFIVGKILKRTNHPKSDKLFVLKIKTNEELQIVTNATNAIEGKNVVVATVGSTLPNGTSIINSKIMGIDSQGMLCSGETLKKEKTDGILIVSKQEGEPFIL